MDRKPLRASHNEASSFVLSLWVVWWVWFPSRSEIKIDDDVTVLRCCLISQRANIFENKNHFLLTSHVSKLNVVIDLCKTIGPLWSHYGCVLVTNLGVLDLKTAMLLQGEAWVLSKQTDAIFPPGDRRFWVPRCLAPKKGHTSHGLCLVGWALSDNGWRSILQGWR